MSKERIYWLAWSKVKGVGPILLDRLKQQFDNLETAWNADREQLLSIDGLGLISVEKLLDSRAKIDPENLILEHTRTNPLFWAQSDSEYPRLLAEIPSAPAVLYYQGKVISAENQGLLPTIGIVGTRNPSDYGRKWARKISNFLAIKGFTIVSGMALGVDTEAHTACLEAGGRTIAVIGTGIDVVYPPQNQKLAATLIEHGLIVSEYAAGTQPDKPHFPARNRIIAGLSRVTIVIEAPTKSGALITAHQANDFGRDVYVLPGSIDNPNAIGCLGLLSRGAQPILGLDHLMELLAAIPQLDPPAQLQLFPTAPSAPELSKVVTPPPDLTPDLRTVWLAVTIEPTNFDAIVAQAQLPVEIVSSSLLHLELLGLVMQLPGMRYQR